MGEPSRFKLRNTGQVTRVYIRNEKSAQTKRAQTRKDKEAVKVQKRKVHGKELSQYESEIRGSVHVLNVCIRTEMKRNGIVQHNDEEWKRSVSVRK